MHHIDHEDGAELVGATSAAGGVPSDFLATIFPGARPVGEIAGEGSSTGESEGENSDQDDEPDCLIHPCMLHKGQVLPNSELGVQPPDERVRALFVRWLGCLPSYAVPSLPTSTICTRGWHDSSLGAAG